MNSRQRLAGAAIAMVVGLAAACSRNPASRQEGDPGAAATTGNAAPLPSPSASERALPVASSTEPACASGGPCPVASNCSDAWLPLSPDSAAWLTSPLASCAEAPSHSPSQLYDSCALANLGGCEIPATGALYCHGGYLVATCRTASDCPTGWVCINTSGFPGDVEDANPAAYGHCAKSCTGTSPSECGRCDLKCDPKFKVCSSTVPTATPCVSDCECGGGICTQEGVCDYATGNLPVMSDFCDPEGKKTYPDACSCTGGASCRASDRCCVLPDGSIANHKSTQCK